MTPWKRSIKLRTQYPGSVVPLAIFVLFFCFDCIWISMMRFFAHFTSSPKLPKLILQPFLQLQIFFKWVTLYASTILKLCLCFGYLQCRLQCCHWPHRPGGHSLFGTEWEHVRCCLFRSSWCCWRWWRPLDTWGCLGLGCGCWLWSWLPNRTHQNGILYGLDKRTICPSLVWL